MSNRMERRTVFGRMLPRSVDEEVAPGIVMVAGFGNTGIVFTDEGVVVIDNTPQTAAHVIEVIRARTDKPIYAIIYTHGHGDHAWATGAFLEDAQKRGHARPKVIGHEVVAERFQRYAELGRWNRFINGIQSGRVYARPAPDESFTPADVVYPDITYRSEMQFRLGGLTFELYHCKGETDDGTWVWVPERRVAFTGDLNVGCCPNIGNPFKLQRYETEWAEGLERIAGKQPEAIVPGHGALIRGANVQEVCLMTAKFLRYLHDEVVRLLNDGCWIEDILDRVKVPAEFADKPYLAPIYGCPTYVIHGIQRRYAGWFNGNASELFPSRRADTAAEVVKLTGAGKLLARARELQNAGDPQQALHLVDFVVYGADAGAKKEALLLKAELLDARAEKEVNSIARNIFIISAEKAEQEGKGITGL